MSGLYTTLNASVLALSAHGKALEIAGRNLANVSNADYARQRVVYGDRGTVLTPQGAQSLGLEAIAVRQVRDRLLDRQYVRESALAGFGEAEQQAYARAQAALGQTIEGTAILDGTAAAGTGGLAAALDGFFNAFQDLAIRPTDVGARQTLFQKASILADGLRTTDARLAQVQGDLDAQIEGDLATVNRLLDNLRELNTQISRFEVNQPESAVDLRDRRQARLEELARYLPLEVRDLPDGQWQVTTRAADGTAVPLIDPPGLPGAVTFDGSTITAGSPPAALARDAGALAGALAARDGVVQTVRQQLDDLARQLVTAVNAAYNPGAIAGDDFFAPAGLAAGSIRLDAALSAANLRAGTGAAGDNSLALAVAAVATQRFATTAGDAIDGTLGGWYGGIVSGLGQALAGAEARAEDQAGIRQLIRNQRDAVSGVSLDEEMAELVRFQRAYQASARVFAIVDELLDTTVNRLGR